jgi:prepilin signal peptidase PulO-like enzyme (type II secretory pathway)
VTPLALGLGVVGLVLGILSDRLATRWPEHDEETPAGRPIGWRTAVCAAFGAFAFAILPTRFAGDPLALALFGAWFATLVVGMATDLDQRLLPDVLTLPVIPVALVYAVSGRNPLVGPELVPALIVATAVPLVLCLLWIPFGDGAFGSGVV